VIVGQPQAPTDEATIRALEEESRIAVLNRDFATLERIWSERFVVNAPVDYVLPNRAAVFDLFRRGIGVYSSHEKKIERIVFDGDVAIVMGAETVVPLNAPKGSQPLQRRFTNIWRFENGNWRLIARQATMIAPGAPSAPPPATPK
jgi:ketosteroid isomerase-like protein